MRGIFRVLFGWLCILTGTVLILSSVTPVNGGGIAFGIFYFMLGGLAISWGLSNAVSYRRSRHISASVREAVWDRDGGYCQNCGTTADLQFDHVYPFSKGGSNDYDNIQLLCARCNSQKGAKV
jgi:hypothetical protein